MTGLERAEEDVRRGDYGRARQRLTSYLASRGYDARVAARIGQISHDMRDVYQAGRFWLLSGAEGQQVDEAVDLFVRRSGSEPRTIVGQLPRVLRLEDLDAYPEAARQRLRRFGLEEAVVTAAGSDARRRRGSWRDHLHFLGCLVVTLAILAVFLVGLGTIVHWVFY